MPVAVADRGALPVQGLAHQPLVDRNKRGVEQMRMFPTIAWQVDGNGRDAKDTGIPRLKCTVTSDSTE